MAKWCCTVYFAALFYRASLESASCCQRWKSLCICLLTLTKFTFRPSLLLAFLLNSQVIKLNIWPFVRVSVCKAKKERNLDRRGKHMKDNNWKWKADVSFYLPYPRLIWYRAKKRVSKDSGYFEYLWIWGLFSARILQGLYAGAHLHMALFAQSSFISSSGGP